MTHHLRIGLLLALLLGAGGFTQAEETLFYSNTRAGGLMPTLHFSVSDLEIDDDAPFIKSHLVSALRFYGVGPATGNPGLLVKEIVRELPAGFKVIPNILLTSDERFTFSAEPGLRLRDVTGGWFSVRFEPPAGGVLADNLGLRLASGESISGMYNLTLDRPTSPYDPGGVLASDLFFEMSSIDAAGIGPAQVFDLFLTPSSVSAGNSATATLRLSSPAPAGGDCEKNVLNRCLCLASRPESSD